MPAATTARSRAPMVVVLAILSALLVAAPAAAESECVSDAVGDVEDRSDGSTTDLEQADILAVCTSHTADVLEVTVRVAAPTDPETDEAWADFASAVGVAVDTDGDGAEEYDINYGRFPDGVARVAVFDHESGDQLCTAEGGYDTVRYTMRVPRSCIGDPQAVSTAAFIFYSSSVADQASAGFYDEVPERPDFRGPFTTAADPQTGALRLAGPSRVDTAITVSQDDFEDQSAQAVVLARADLFPDALVAAPLAVAKGGPLLLTPSFAVAQVVEDEIQRVLPAGGTVYLSGGTAALSEDVRTEVEALGYAVERLAGDTRYQTAVAVAEAAVAEPALIVVSDGNTFPDALVGGSLAAHEGGVEVITDGTTLDAAASAYLEAHPDAEVVAVGDVAAQAVPEATAIVGPDAFATSVAVAEARYPDSTGAAIASGTNFPDGLTGGAHAARAGIPLLLSWPDVLPDAVAAYLAAGAPIDPVVLYGGVAALSQQVEADAAASA
jgi:putative cell wall-binding protein